MRNTTSVSLKDGLRDFLLIKLQCSYTMAVTRIFDKQNLTNYHRIDVGLCQEDSVSFQKPDPSTDLSILDKVTTVCIYSLSPREMPQPKATGSISVLRDLKNLKEFSWWGMDASDFDWRGFEDLPLISVKINNYVNFDKLMVMPQSLKHVSFTGEDIQGLRDLQAK